MKRILIGLLIIQLLFCGCLGSIKEPSKMEQALEEKYGSYANFKYMESFGDARIYCIETFESNGEIKIKEFPVVILKVKDGYEIQEMKSHIYSYKTCNVSMI